MKLLVGTTPVLVDTSDEYPDRGTSGQVVMVQNLGPGTLYADFTEDPVNGIRLLSSGDAYEFERAAGQDLYVVSTESNTDVRVVAVG